jgi:hypothetical protein
MKRKGRRNRKAERSMRRIHVLKDFVVAMGRGLDMQKNDSKIFVSKQCSFLFFSSVRMLSLHVSAQMTVFWFLDGLNRLLNLYMPWVWPRSSGSRDISLGLTGGCSISLGGYRLMLR